MNLILLEAADFVATLTQTVSQSVIQAMVQSQGKGETANPGATGTQPNGKKVMEKLMTLHNTCCQDYNFTISEVLLLEWRT